MDHLVLPGVIDISLGLFTVLMLAACLYFTLTYFEHLKREDGRLLKRSKLFAVVTLFLALGVPGFYQLYTFIRIMS